MNTYTITHLTTARDTKPVAYSTKRLWRGPATILTIKNTDGSIHEIEYDYAPNESVDSLLAMCVDGN